MMGGKVEATVWGGGLILANREDIGGVIKFSIR
jgi:hypothetical protein